MVVEVVRVTLTRPSWHRSDMVQWLVSCATELGYEALISLMKSWYTLFTPAEATSQSLIAVLLCWFHGPTSTIPDYLPFLFFVTVSIYSRISQQLLAEF